VSSCDDMYFVDVGSSGPQARPVKRDWALHHDSSSGILPNLTDGDADWSAS
jgi:hypothetical protein